MKIFLHLGFFLFSTLLISNLLIQPIFAGTNVDPNAKTNPDGTPITPANGTVILESPIAAKNVNELISKVIIFIMGIIGSLTLLMFVYGGLTWMTAAGAADKVKKGRDILVWAIIGLAAILFSYAMVDFVLKGLGV
ncbi:MAG: hypothetical protein WCK11_02185 [Candidatus Falkowbacteria bacterium]